MMAWFRRKNEIQDAISTGQLDRAIELTSRLGDSKAAKAYHRQLTEALVHRANTAADSDDYLRAWQSLSHAVTLAVHQQIEMVSLATEQLQTKTLSKADTMLQDGQNQQAADLVKLLADRDLSNPQSDRIGSVAQLLNTVDELTLAGKLEDAIDRLKSAQRLYPNLTALETQVASYQERKQQLDSLTQSLQSAALACRWNEVCQLCDQILKIAPQHEIAAGARRHAAQRAKRRTSVGSRLTNVPDSPEQDGNLVIKPLASANRNLKDTAVMQAESSAISGGPAGPSSVNKTPLTEVTESDLATDQDFRLAIQASSFLIWVDGVGGYLVCTKPINFIGQAGGNSTVSIPLQADIRQRHVRLETVAGRHLIQPLGPVGIAGREVPVDESIVINSGQHISLDGKVELLYRQDHPLSKSARLDFVSRHRTLPWSDGVILAGQSIILGPNPNNHVFCPSWKTDLILFQRNDQWFAKSKVAFCVDDQALTTQSEIHFESHLFGDSFSLKLEAVLLDG